MSSPQSGYEWMQNCSNHVFRVSFIDKRFDLINNILISRKLHKTSPYDKRYWYEFVFPNKWNESLLQQR